MMKRLSLISEFTGIKRRALFFCFKLTSNYHIESLLFIDLSMSFYGISESFNNVTSSVQEGTIFCD